MQELLKARTRALTPDAPKGGAFVLYWMRTAVRADENPALDVAIAMGNELGLPVFVYHAVSERTPYANDRLHRFILEGARDVAPKLRERGVATAFHCERPGHRGPHLKTLADRAALVVTEEMPVSPLREWTRALADGTSTPVWAVDTACIVPMRVVGAGIDRAFAYRKRASAHLERFLAPWEPEQPAVEPVLPELPFEPVDLEHADLGELIAACAIDHTVAPVPHTRGGSTAGYARWEAFRDGPLRAYASDRNDPVRQGNSRLSPYLHFGMVAPTRIGREARERGGRGADKFFDELFTWRELAYTWCLYQAVHEGLDALPDWARDTLLDHADDPREALYDRETLARGRTGHRLWDLAQRSLLVHGELHNNLRMTWGKALVGWTRGPQQALDALVDLNHRYALDGRDPASYGGLLWCLGQFDRPFPQQPVFGSVRGRSLSAHARRLDLDGYAALVGAPLVTTPPRVAVVGAGPAGAFGARVLADHGVPVVLFDKARGAGGRMSTRRDGALRFDHGAQYLTLRDPRLARYADAWLEQGLLARWDGPFVRLTSSGAVPDVPRSPRFVPVPAANALVKHLLRDLDVRFGTRIDALERDGDGWTVGGERFDQVVVAVPAPQAVPLLGAHGFAERLSGVGIAPCWTVLAGADGDPGWAAARVEEGPLSWIARDQCRPGRSGGEQWVLQASPAWSTTSLEADPDEVAHTLASAASDLTGLSIEPRAAHRWRYALVTDPVGEDALFDPEAGLGVCGDALLGGRVEAALLSGAALAGRLLGAAVAASPGDRGSVPGQEAPALFG